MKRYDFSSPINITMIFEEDQDEPLFQNASSEDNENDDICQDKTENNNTNAFTRVQSPFENLQKNDAIANQEPAFYHENPLQNIDNMLPENSSPTSKGTGKTCEVNLSTSVQKYCNSNTTENIEHMYVIGQSGTNKEAIDRNIKVLLDIVSENLTMVMRLYYNSYYGMQKKNPAEADKFLQKFHKYQAHFFGLSYSTVVSLILPEEKNEIFVDKLLNKIVADANKVIQGRCERKHVEPFYNQMIEWVKKKRDQLKKIGLKCDNKEKSCKKFKNENRTLKTLLADSPPALKTPNTMPNVSELSEKSASLHSPSLSHVNFGDTTAEPSISIFTAGDPEKEISINVHPDLLQNQCSYQDLIDTHVNISNKNNSKNSSPHPRHYNQRVNQVQRNGHHQLNNVYHNIAQIRAPQPQYYSNHIHHTTSNVILPNFQNTAHGGHDYQTQLNNNSFTSSVYNNAKPRQMVSSSSIFLNTFYYKCL